MPVTGFDRYDLKSSNLPSGMHGDTRTIHIGNARVNGNVAIRNIVWCLWLSKFFISDHYTKLGTISRSVPCWATYSPCCVWGRGWSTCHCITIIYDFKINPGVTFCLVPENTHSLCLSINHQKSCDYENTIARVVLQPVAPSTRSLFVSSECTENDQDRLHMISCFPHYINFLKIADVLTDPNRKQNCLIE